MSSSSDAHSITRFRPAPGITEDMITEEKIPLGNVTKSLHCRQHKSTHRFGMTHIYRTYYKNQVPAVPLIGECQRGRAIASDIPETYIKVFQ